MALLQLEHNGGAKVRRAATSSGNGKRQKAAVLRFKLLQVPGRGSFGHRLPAGPLLIPTGPPVAGQDGATVVRNNRKGDVIPDSWKSHHSNHETKNQYSMQLCSNSIRRYAFAKNPAA